MRDPTGLPWFVEATRPRRSPQDVPIPRAHRYTAQVHRALPVLIAVVGCYDPPDLPPFEGVPRQSFDSCAPTRTELVDCVIDGDTFDIGRCGVEGGSERFRLLGIDAPETEKSDAPAECYANRARDELERLIETQSVVLEFDKECEGAFGRTLAWVFLEDEDDPQSRLNVNVWMAQRGLARLYTEFESDELRYASELQAAETAARADGIGLWGACDGE